MDSEGRDGVDEAGLPPEYYDLVLIDVISPRPS